MPPTSYQMRVPATSANLGPGFDCLGVALDLYNTFEIALREPGRFAARMDGPESHELRIDPEKNTLVDAFRRGWKLGGGASPAPGIDQRVDVRIPATRGLGSSSTAIVAGLAAGFHAASGRLDWPKLLPAMAELEGHPDNVLAAALGGLVCAAWADGELSYSRTQVAPGLAALAYIPDAKLSTRRARQCLPEAVPHADAVYNAARVPLVIDALRRGDIDLLRSAMRDRLHQQYRRDLLPAFDAVEEFARENKLPYAVSGAGPTMLIWCRVGRGEELAAEFSAIHSELARSGTLRVFRPINHGLLCREFLGV